MILKLLSECCTLMQFIAVGVRGLGAVPLHFWADQLTLSQPGCRLCPPYYLCAPPPVFSDLPTALQVHTGSMVPTNILYSRFTCTLLTYVHIPSSYRVIFENYITKLLFNIQSKPYFILNLKLMTILKYSQV